MGDKLTDTGIMPNPKKIKGIVNIKKPENKKALQRFLVMFNYLSKFVPGLSTKTALLRSLI